MHLKNLVSFIEKKESRRNTVKFIFLISLTAIIAFSLMSCKKEKIVEKEVLTNVRVSTSVKKNIRPYIETTGTLTADEEVTVSSEVDGIVRSVRVEEESAVGKGTLLAEVNDIDYVLDEKRAQAALKQAQANLTNVKAEFQRKEALFKEELITQQQFDDISTRVALAEADLAKAKATLDTARERLARTKIYSPLRAMVKEKRVSVGDYVRTSMPLFQLIKVDRLKLNFTVGEKELADLKTSQEVDFTVDSFPGRKFKGTVHLLYPHLEERTRTLQAEAVVVNAENLLKPGLFARATIYTGALREVVVAPLTSLLYDDATVSLFVVEGNTARSRTVKTGRKYGEDIEIIEGLNEKEQVVVVGQNNLSDGVKVHVAR